MGRWPVYPFLVVAAGCIDCLESIHVRGPLSQDPGMGHFFFLAASDFRFGRPLGFKAQGPSYITSLGCPVPVHQTTTAPSAPTPAHQQPSAHLGVCSQSWLMISGNLQAWGITSIHTEAKELMGMSGRPCIGGDFKFYNFICLSSI